MNHATDQFVEVHGTLCKGEIFAGNQKFILGSWLQRNELVSQEPRSSNRRPTIHRKFKISRQVQLNPGAQILVECNGLNSADSNATDPYRRPGRESTNIVKGSEKNEATGVAKRQATHLERHIGNQDESGQDEEPDGQIAMGCGLHFVPPRSDTPERRE